MLSVALLDGVRYWVNEPCNLAICRYQDEGFLPNLYNLAQEKYGLNFMSDASTYSVISTGQIHDDFGITDVQESFAKLFKTTPEKASKYVGVKKILKKDLNHTKAQALKSRLESIGMVIALKEHKSSTAIRPYGVVYRR